MTAIREYRKTEYLFHKKSIKSKKFVHASNANELFDINVHCGKDLGQILAGRRYDSGALQYCKYE